MKTPARQRGLTLLETLIAVIVLITITATNAIRLKRDLERQVAQNVGIRVAQYNSAVAAFINARGPTNPPLGTRTGVTWLQSGACPGGTNAVDYLPCSFDPTLPWGLSYNTTVTAGPAANQVVATTDLGIASVGGRRRLDLAAKATSAARAFNGSARSAAESIAGFTRYGLDLTPGSPTENHLIARVDTATSADAWIRRDGTNSPTATINWGNQEIVNARNLSLASTRSKDGRPTSVANALGNAQVVLSGSPRQRVTKPTCPTGTAPQIYIVPIAFSSAAVAGNPVTELGALDFQITQNTATFWEVAFFATRRVSSGNATVEITALNRAQALAMTACE